MPTRRSSVFPSSSVCAGTRAIPSWRSSSAGWGTIRRLRIAGKVTGEGMPAVNGRLSTHVLDTHAGRPAIGVAIELYEFAGEKAHCIQSAITNSDGRTDQPLIGGRPLPIGRYELRFAVGDYFVARQVPMSDPPFLDRIPVRFSV